MSNEEAALIGAGVGGVIALVGTLLSALFDYWRRRADMLRRDVEWRREKCNEAYSEAIYYLFKLQLSASRSDLADKEVRQHLSEAQRYLSLLQAYHPSNRERARLKSAADSIRAGAQAPDTLANAAEGAMGIVEDSLQSTWSPTIRH
jgi:hypothetical protein